MKKWSWWLIFWLVCSAVPAQAQQWQLDPDHSRFYFAIQHIYATVRGEFADFSGEVAFDPAHPEQSRFNLVVKTKSVNTNIGKRDTHLRSDDFFAAGKYPRMTFKSTKVSKIGDNRFRADGLLTIKDVSKALPLEFVYHGQKESPLMPGKIVAGLDTTFTLDRLAFHVGDGKFYQLGAIGKDVEVLITLELLRDK
ncbi:MAG: YceI family protein [Desulfobulbaceae bacterium]|nr:YceI family protein [Desulfobulbaceae bacterium]